MPDIGALVREKRSRGLTVSVCLPARDEEATVGDIVASVKGIPLVDEVVVVDDGSTDGTAVVATRAGARVERSSDILPEFGPSLGKGDAMWRSLHVTSGDVVCWLDADLVDFDPRFVTGLLGPLLTRPPVGFVKGSYERPGGGGRVTELMARPLISLLFPHLAHVAQPLGGEYAARRDLVEHLAFPAGWGVDLGLLIDAVDRFGPGCLAQADLGIRHHRSRTLRDLGPQAMAVLVTALARAGLDDEAHGEELLVGTERVPVVTTERPPMASVAAYHRAREQSA